MDLRLLWYALEHEMPGAAKDALRAYGASSLAKVHAHLERMIEGKDWLLGDQRSLADAHFIGIARWTNCHDVLDRRDYPWVQRLYEELENDTAVRFAHATERGEAAESSRGFTGEITLEEALSLHRQAA